MEDNIEEQEIYTIENKKYKPDSLKFVINRSIILEQLIVWAAFCTPNFKACIASNENTKKIQMR